MTEDEARDLNELSARLVAVELMVTWLLADYLKRSRDVDADLLLSKALEAEPDNKTREFIDMYRRRITTLVRTAETLLNP